MMITSDESSVASELLGWEGATLSWCRGGGGAGGQFGMELELLEGSMLTRLSQNGCGGFTICSLMMVMMMTMVVNDDDDDDDDGCQHAGSQDHDDNDDDGVVAASVLASSSMMTDGSHKKCQMTDSR